MSEKYVPKIDPKSAFAENLSNGLTHLGKLIGQVSVSNGWDTSRGMVANADDYDPKWITAHKVAELGLITTEVAEAIEEVRHGNAMNELYFSGAKESPYDPSQSHNNDGSPRKPEGVPSELADVIIRALDIADAWSIDLGAAIVEKINYNTTRGLHHGGKAI